MLIKTKKTYVERYVHEYLCDICGENINNLNCRGDRWDDMDPIRASIGHAYPDGDCRTTYALDVCGLCFITKLKPAIETVTAMREFYTVDGDTPLEKENETCGC